MTSRLLPALFFVRIRRPGRLLHPDVSSSPSTMARSRWAVDTRDYDRSSGFYELATGRQRTRVSKDQVRSIKDM